MNVLSIAKFQDRIYVGHESKAVAMESQGQAETMDTVIALLVSKPSNFQPRVNDTC